jgi:hypothetical protein
MLTGLRRTVLLVMALLLVVATAAGTADARSPKAKPAKAKKPVIYVFKGEIAEVGEGSVTVSVEKGNKFARSFAGDQGEFAVSRSTKVVKDDIRVSPAERTAGDEVVVGSRGETFSPQFLGALPCARCPLDALAKIGESEMFVEHSSTKRNLSETMLLT